MTGSLLSVGALHALAYCERLFYLEEVERIRLADASVFAGRALHAEREATASDEEIVEERFESTSLGLIGRVDLLKKRNGQVVPYERKRGRSAGAAGAREAWRTDRIQVAAYALLLEEASGKDVSEALVRYHADSVTVAVRIDAPLRAELRQAIDRAAELRATVERPPVTDNERLCVRCSLAPACLPEEARRAADASFRPLRLFPPLADRTTVHVLEQGARVGRAGEEVVVTGSEERRFPVAEVGAVVLHGFAQISTQALRLCADHDVAVHWMTLGGTLTGSLAATAPTAQRQLRQFEALRDEAFRLGLAKRLVHAKLAAQLRFVLRATREAGARGAGIADHIARIRVALRQATGASTPFELLGFEGSGAAAYFDAVAELLSDGLDTRLRFSGRNRRPPRDRVNALLGYGYGMLYREVVSAIVAVGLHPGVGFYHRPRSAAHTLALDLMELFRVPLVDMAVVGALNRRSFDADADFVETPGQVLLSASGRRKAIDLFERRKGDTWRHDVVGYSLSYGRMIELEARLLEKEWCGEGGLFAKFRIR